ncbi:MAG: lipoyl synthase [Magnetococcales bacterium]|nr:lipoyl synthase [Magnetococcales bacterium]
MAAPVVAKPRWLRVEAPLSTEFLQFRRRLQGHGVATVCVEANCPNIGGCWRGGSAAFMILGTRCTRRCAFCDVETGRPDAVDAEEPQRLAALVAEVGFSHVVLTSVDRDDLEDGGAGHFAACIEALRALPHTPRVEVLTPDFQGRAADLETVLRARPAVFNHNIETVSRLWPQVKPGSRFLTSLTLLAQARRWRDAGAEVVVKSGFMLGLGETAEEVYELLDQLRDAGVEMLTIGQYLRPSAKHHPVERYWEPEWFELLGRRAKEMGFSRVASHPLVRSSWHAGELLHDS